MVEPAPKRTNPVDRISELPEPIISDILSSIPTKDAVATSILSRSWRFRWTRVTSFNFRKIEWGNHDATHDFSDFVSMVLRKHSGEPINKFVLLWESPHFRSAQLNSWVDTAIARKVRVLDLRAGCSWKKRGKGEFHLPFSLYTSATLEVLKLDGPFRVDPPNIICLPKLAEIELYCVIYDSDASIPILLSGCPSLESLTIETFDYNDNMVVYRISSPALKRLSIRFRAYLNDDAELRIDAPALEYLKLFDRMSSHISIQKRLSSVNKVSLDVMCSDHNMAVGFLQSFGTVKFLTIRERRTRFGKDLLQVDFKGVATYSYCNRLPWSGMLDVLESCVNLEELEIWCCESNDNRIGRGILDLLEIWFCVSNDNRIGRCPRSPLSSLKCLTFRCFSGRKWEMEMLKFFLDHCSVMELVHLSDSYNEPPLDAAKMVEILNEVSKWFRASPTCKISWHKFPGPQSCFKSLDEE